MLKDTNIKEQTLTIITAPVDVDAAPIVAGELGEGEAGGVGCRHSESLADYTLYTFISDASKHNYTHIKAVCTDNYE